MDAQLLVLCALTFVINLIGALAYAARIAGVRTRRIAVSFALFNILVLVSRASNSFQQPFLANRIEENLKAGGGSLFVDFQILMGSATLAAIVGTLAVPTGQRIFTRAVQHFHEHRSMPKLILHVFAKGGIGYLKTAAAAPSVENVKGLELREMNDSEVCCGFGGTFAVKYKPISLGMGEQKVHNASDSGADYLISTDLSCLMHLDGYIRKHGQTIRIMHIADVLASGW